MFSGGSKGNIGMKGVKIKSKLATYIPFKKSPLKNLHN